MSDAEPVKREARELSSLLKIEVGLAQGLLQKRDALKVVLSSLQDDLIEKGKHTKDNVAFKLERQRFLTDSLNDAKSMTDRKQNEVDKLNVSEPMERLEATGTPWKQEVKWKLFHLTPNFAFDLSTAYPIRHANVVNEKPTSVWKSETPVESFYGGKTFQMKLKNKSLRSASARVELYGWPKEIHHEELARKERELLDRISEQRQLRQQVDEGFSELAQLESKNKVYGRAVAECSRDLQKVQDLRALKLIQRERLLRYIEADSIYGLAIMLDLKSTVPVETPLVDNFETSRAIFLLQGQKHVFAAMQEHVTDVSRMVDELAMKKFARENEFKYSAETLLGSKITNSQGHNDFQKARIKIAATSVLGMDDEQTTLVKKSQLAISKLQSDFEDFQRRKNVLFAESSEQRLQEFDCKEEIKEVQKELSLDWRSNQSVMSTWAAEKLPIGVMATVKEATFIPDAVASIQRAERLRISEIDTGNP